MSRGEGARRGHRAPEGVADNGTCVYSRAEPQGSSSLDGQAAGVSTLCGRQPTARDRRARPPTIAAPVVWETGFIQTLQQECLDYFVVFGERHMNHLVSEMVAHYHEERPHQAKENNPLIRESSEPQKKKPGGRKESAPPPDVVPLGDIKCRKRLGGLLKHYSRRAA